MSVDLGNSKDRPGPLACAHHTATRLGGKGVEAGPSQGGGASVRSDARVKAYAFTWWC